MLCRFYRQFASRELTCLLLYDIQFSFLILDSLHIRCRFWKMVGCPGHGCLVWGFDNRCPDG